MDYTNDKHSIVVCSKRGLFIPEGDPTNFLTFFRRGTVYFALGKARNALVDFTKAIELKPDFTAARVQRGNVYMKMGDYQNAELDYYEVIIRRHFLDLILY